MSDRHDPLTSGALLTTGQVSHIFHVDPSTVRLWVARGLIDVGYTPSGQRRFPEQEVRRVLAGKTREAWYERGEQHDDADLGI